jgi:hypothetical protein
MHTLALLDHLQIINDDISVKVTTIAGRLKDPRRFRVATLLIVVGVWAAHIYGKNSTNVNLFLQVGTIVFCFLVNSAPAHLLRSSI